MLQCHEDKGKCSEVEEVEKNSLHKQWEKQEALPVQHQVELSLKFYNHPAPESV